jgi:hypothetical protein
MQGLFPVAFCFAPSIAVDLGLHCDGMQLTYAKEAHICHLAAPTEAVTLFKIVPENLPLSKN